MKELSIEQKARAYDEALEKSKRLYEQGTITESLAYIFPKLKESEDERIRKDIISYIKAIANNENISPDSKKECKTWLVWLEKQGKQEQLYIRFGGIPTDEKSKIYRGEIEVGTENGVSVYPAFKTDEGDIVLGLNLPITKTTLYTQQHLIEYDDRPCYLVKGDYVGKDTDGQPLINNVSIIEKIDSYRVKEEKADKVEPKFKVGDTMRTLQEASNGITEGTPVVVSIDNEYYRCNNETIAIKDQNNYEYPPINKRHNAWSEEDENTIKVLMNIIRKSEIIDSIIYTDSLKEKLYDWLKSLRPQNTWKPSDEQITVLELASKYERVFTPKQIDILIDLKEQLKKLKGE